MVIKKNLWRYILTYRKSKSITDYNLYLLLVILILNFLFWKSTSKTYSEKNCILKKDTQVTAVAEDTADAENGGGDVNAVVAVTDLDGEDGY